VADAPPNSTCAPLTKLLAGDRQRVCAGGEIRGTYVTDRGVGFHSVTSLVPLALESATETAATVIVFGFGRVTGAV